MTDGNWKLGMFIDENATDEQADKLGAVFGGQLGGPMAALGPLVGEVLGVERVPIEVVDDGLSHSVKIGDLIDFEIEDIVPFGIETDSPFGSRACSTRSHRSSRPPRPSARRSVHSVSSTRERRDSRRPSSPGQPDGDLTATAHAEAPRQPGGLAPAFAAVRMRLGLVALLFALAVIGWWWTYDQMQDMDGGPWTDLGTLGWFVGVWIVMMAAMMFPSVAPTVALYSKLTKSRSPAAPLLFTAGYLVDVGMRRSAGVRGRGGRRLGGERRAGMGSRWALDRRGDARRRGDLRADASEGRVSREVPEPARLSPRLLEGWTARRRGMGARHGLWCIGCCWALMASLFALGVMSIAWMAFVAGLIAFEKLVPWRRAATFGTAAILLTLGALLLATPNAIPGLTIPGSGSMTNMQMDSSGSQPMAPAHTQMGSSQPEPMSP